MILLFVPGNGDFETLAYTSEKLEPEREYNDSDMFRYTPK